MVDSRHSPRVPWETDGHRTVLHTGCVGRRNPTGDHGRRSALGEPPAMVDRSAHRVRQVDADGGRTGQLRAAPPLIVRLAHWVWLSNLSVERPLTDLEVDPFA